MSPYVNDKSEVRGELDRICKGAVLKWKDMSFLLCVSETV